MLPTASPNPPTGTKSQQKSQTAYAATVLLMASSLLSGLLALVRTKYIAYVFGAGHLTDAYTAAFQLPDMISYFLVGGVASISLITIFNRYRHAGDHAGADRALSIVLNAMLVILGTAILLAEILAPLYTHAFFPKFDPETSALCTHLTRILLPSQLFFFAGGVLGARLLASKIFLYQALQPIVYNLGIILGAVFLARTLGIDSLAWGVFAGSLAGPFLLNAVGAFKGGYRFTPILSPRHPAFREWLTLSLPLMIGVSLTMADKWILSHYATADTGGVTLLNTAKTLFNSPLSVIGMAAGAASLPFFSSLYTQGRLFDFNAAVTRAVTRLVAFSLLLTAWMCALAGPLVDLLRGGSFSPADARATAHFFTLFALSLALWSALQIYIRAFYAAGNTLTPAITGTVVTLLAIPMYAWLFQAYGLSGLAIASDLGILALTVTLAIQLHRKRLVSLASLDAPEILRATLAATLAYFLCVSCTHWLPHPHGHTGDVLLITAVTLVWLATSVGTLLATGSKLPAQLRTRR